MSVRWDEPDLFGQEVRELRAARRRASESERLAVRIVDAIDTAPRPALRRALATVDISTLRRMLDQLAP